MRQYILLSLALVAHGFITSMGYVVLMEKFDQFSILFLILMFIHLIASSLFISYGFMFLELKGVLVNFHKNNPDAEGGRVYKQLMGEE